jgi:hypothetical protein
MNETYRSHFPPDRLPDRTCVGVTGLAYDALIDIPRTRTGDGQRRDGEGPCHLA